MWAGAKGEVKELKAKGKSQQQPVFPVGLPSKYSLGPTLLTFGDQNRSGAFRVLCPYTLPVVAGRLKSLVLTSQAQLVPRFTRAPACPPACLLPCLPATTILRGARMGG